MKFFTQITYHWFVLALLVWLAGNPNHVLAATPCEVSNYNDGFIPLDDFGANGNDLLEDDAAFKKTFSCLKTISSNFDSDDHFVIYIGPGHYYVSDMLELNDIVVRDQQSVHIKGAGMGVTEVIAKPNNTQGIFNFDIDSNEVKLKISNLSISPGSTASGAAIKALFPITNDRANSEHQLEIEDVSIVGNDIPSTLFSFTDGIIVEGAKNPRFNNVKISGPYGPLVNTLQGWFTYNTNLKLINTYGAEIEGVSLWGADSGLVVENNSQVLSDEPGVSIYNTVSVHMENGIVAQGSHPLRSVNIDYSHVNAAQIGVEVGKDWEVNAKNNLFYHMYYGRKNNPYYFFDIKNNSKISVDGNISVIPAPASEAPKIQDVIMINYSGADSVKFTENHVTHSAYVFAAEPTNNVYEDNNILSSDVTIFPNSLKIKPVQVITPNGDESYKRGDILQIKWDDPSHVDETKSYYVTLTGSNLATSNLELTNSAVANSFSWKIPTSIQDGRYGIRVCRRGGSSTGRCDQSEHLFNVVGDKLPSKVTLTSPNGGESYRVNDIVKIRWNDTAATSDTSYYVVLTGQLLEKKTLVLSSFARNGQFQWRVNEYLIPGKYGIRICRRSLTVFEGRCDQSDYLFDIKQ